MEDDHQPSIFNTNQNAIQTGEIGNNSDLSTNTDNNSNDNLCINLNTSQNNLNEANNNNYSNTPNNYPNNDPNDNKPNIAYNEPDNYQNYPNNFPDNNPPIDNYPDNDNNININNNSQNDGDLNTIQINPDKNVAATAKSAPKNPKNYKPTIRPNIDSNFKEDPRIAKFKSLFESKRKNYEYKTICFDISNYSKLGIENAFEKYDRSVKTDSNFSKSSYSKIMQHTSSDKLPSVSSSDQFSRSLTTEKYKKKANLEMKVKLGRLKQLYLCHFYKKVPENFNQQYLVDQINFYMANECISLARIHGISMTDSKGNFFPTVLTNRPVNGPLSSLFESIRSNRDGKGQTSIDTFNIDEVKSISSESKFALICGITSAIEFIHENDFIHSNLSPETVYLDENIFPVVCDHIFIPDFSIELNEENEEFSFQLKKVTDDIQNQIYVAPEIRNCEVIKSSADIYSLGLIFYFILTENEAKPFVDENSLVFPEGFSEEWKELIKRCVSSDPLKRPTASDILEKELFDDKKMQVYVKSINPEIVTSSISETTNLYLILLKSKGKVVFDIFRKMIPNIADIDYETKLIMMAAEKGNADCLDKVGDFFFKGKNNLFQDECWAYECYAEASKRGNAHSSFLCAQFSEKGIGIHVNLTNAISFYRKAIEQASQEEKNRPKIEAKIEYLEDLNRTLLVSVPLKTTSNDIKKLFPEKNVDVILMNEKESNQHMKIKFKNNEELNEVLAMFKENPKNFKIDGQDIRIGMPYSTRMMESNRYKSISPSLHIELKDYFLKLQNNYYINLGKGAYADTYLVGKKGTNEEYAAKVFKKPLNIKHVNLLKREILMSSNLNHPCILRYVGFNEHSLVQYIEKKATREILPTLLMEYIPKGTLEIAIKERIVNFDDTARLKVIIGIASALNEMFINNIVHRDLKPENILLNDKFEPVIGDLGLSRQFTNLLTNKMTDKVGTPIFMAPELINYIEGPLYYKSEVDVYSFGIILFQILTFTKTMKIYPEAKTRPLDLFKYKLNNDYVSELLEKFEMNQAFKNLILLCWNVEKNERPDPPTIYNTIVDTVYESKKPLLPNADMDTVKNYIESLPKI